MAIIYFSMIRYKVSSSNYFVGTPWHFTDRADGRRGRTDGRMVTTLRRLTSTLTQALEKSPDYCYQS